MSHEDSIVVQYPEAIQSTLHQDVSAVYFEEDTEVSHSHIVG